MGKPHRRDCTTFARILSFLGISGLLLMGTGCQRETRVQVGNQEQVLHLSNGTEPQDVDPHTTTGEPEHKIQMALFEGLVTEHPKDLSPVPGVAERWDISDDGRVYTFHLRKNARWSNGDPVTAQDFVNSFQRMLMPSLGAEYSYMLYPMKNAEEFNTGKIKDFSEVGAKALDDHTLQVQLHSPTPYFLSLLTHNSWYPVHISTVKEFGKLDDRSNRWTRPKNFVGNGPFVLKDWKVNSYLMVEKSTTYWDAESVRLNKIYFYPIESPDAEERSFRSGMLHVTKETPLHKISTYKKDYPELIRNHPILATYFYRLNTTKPPLNDKRVRKALAMALDREALVKHVTKGGQIPAFNLTPPETAGYTAKAHLSENIDQAKKLLAQAGYPDGKGFPSVEILFNTSENHRAIAEAIQQMWVKNLGISVTLRNEEWKVFLSSTHKFDYQIARAGWNGDYADPNTFLDMFLTGGGNNETGWSNAEYDRLIREASFTGDMQKRIDLFQKAEEILVEEMPIIPIYFYTRTVLIQPSVKGWYANVMDRHPYKYVYLDETESQSGSIRSQKTEPAN